MSEVIEFINDWLAAQFYLYLFLACLIFAKSFPKRSNFYIRIILIMLVMMALDYGYRYIIKTYADPLGYVALRIFLNCVRYFLVYGMCLLSIAMTFEVDMWKNLFCCTTGYTVQHITMIIFQTIKSLPGKRIESWAEMLILIVVFTSMYLFARAIYVIRLRGNIDDIVFDNKYMLVQIIVVLFAVIILGELSGQLVFRNTGLSTKSLILLISAFDFLFCLSALFGLFNNVKGKQMSLEIEILENMREKQRLQYEMSKENIEMLNMRYHDMKHQLDAMDIDDKLKAELKERLGVYTSVIHTGNATLDIILTEKSLSARKYGCEFVFMVDGSGIDGMKSIDVYSMFGNICDNAIEAVRQLPDVAQRIINLSIRRINDSVNISCENFVAKPPEMINGLPQTTKKDKRNHGYGMKSIKSIVEKYKGNMGVTVRDNIFSLTISVPYPILTN